MKTREEIELEIRLLETHIFIHEMKDGWNADDFMENVDDNNKLDALRKELKAYEK